MFDPKVALIGILVKISLGMVTLLLTILERTVIAFTRLPTGVILLSMLLETAPPPYVPAERPKNTPKLEKAVVGDIVRVGHVVVAGNPCQPAGAVNPEGREVGTLRNNT